MMSPGNSLNPLFEKDRDNSPNKSLEIKTEKGWISETREETKIIKDAPKDKFREKVKVISLTMFNFIPKGDASGKKIIGFQIICHNGNVEKGLNFNGLKLKKFFFPLSENELEQFQTKLMNLELPCYAIVEEKIRDNKKMLATNIWFI